MKIGIYFVVSELNLYVCIGNGNVLILDETGQGKQSTVSKYLPPWQESRILGPSSKIPVTFLGVGLKTVLQQDLSEPIFFGDLNYKIKRIFGMPSYSD